jgi:hypothetical protein
MADKGADPGDDKQRNGTDIADADDDVGVDALLDKGLDLVKDLDGEEHHGGGIIPDLDINGK